jgi:3-phenylpropionate/cinnamic acid dioxygenase small subunit
MPVAMSDDRDAIAALVYRYAERLDRGDLDGVAALFAAATLRSNRHDVVRRGRDAALALYRGTVILYEGTPCTQHVITNLAIDLDGDRASARCHFSVWQARPDLPLQVILAGRYHDRFAKTDDRWQFADRLILVDLVGDLRRHARG